MARRLSLGAILAGIVAQCLGLALDAVLHARDAGLAGRESVLTLSNPGHLLFAIGLALTVLGGASLIMAPVRRGRAGARAIALGALPAAAVLALAGGSFAIAARSGGLAGHQHPAAAADHPAHVESASGQQDAPQASAHSHGSVGAAGSVDGSRHDHGAEVNVSWEQLREIDGMLTAAKEATEKYRDVNVARADGYLQVTQVVPGLGAHFIQPALIAAGAFDVTHPSILLYDRAGDGGFELVGVSWMLPKRAGDETPPRAFFGALGTWHYHTDLCFATQRGGPVVRTGTAAECRAAGGAWVKETGWMMHAWLFRPSPEGVFSHQNSTIKGVGPVLAGP
jgi:hypothetical protein